MSYPSEIPAGTPEVPAGTGRVRGATSSPVRDILALTERPGVVSFAGGLPAADLFDVAGLRRAFAEVLSDESGGRALQYSTTEGDPFLRALVAERLTARGLPTAAVLGQNRGERRAQAGDVEQVGRR